MHLPYVVLSFPPLIFSRPY